MLHWLYKTTRSLFLHGFFTLFPITATVVIVHYGYMLVAGWVAPLKKFVPPFLASVPGAEFFLVLLFIFAIGVVLKFFILSPVVKAGEAFIKRIPLISIIYSSAKILGDFFNLPNPTTVERRVVLVEFPRKDVYNIAFLLDSAENSFQPLLPKNSKRHYKVFMPNSPNPTSGYFMVVPEDEIIDTNITFEEAIKTVMSCGIHTPESLGGGDSLDKVELK